MRSACVRIRFILHNFFSGIGLGGPRTPPPLATPLNLDLQLQHPEHYRFHNHFNPERNLGNFHCL